jgi:hypothetical protein
MVYQHFFFSCFCCFCFFFFFFFSHRPFVFGIVPLVPCNPPAGLGQFSGITSGSGWEYVPSRESLGFSWGPSSLGRKG